MEVSFPSGKTAPIVINPSSYGEEGKYFELSGGPFKDDFFACYGEGPYVGEEWIITKYEDGWRAELKEDDA